MAYGKPDRLYTSDDLVRGYDKSDPLTFVKSWDFNAYQTYVADGSAAPASNEIRLAQAEHDAHIAEALKAFLTREPKPKLVGIMGGHSLILLDVSDVWCGVEALGVRYGVLVEIEGND